MKPIVDISYWQGLPYRDSPDDPGIDFDLLKSKTEGVIARAGHGHAEDLRFTQYVAGLGDHCRGAYWYVVEDADPVHQAEAFLDVVDGIEFGYTQLAGDTLAPILWADFEDNNAGLGKDALARHYAAFLQHLELSRPDLKGWGIGIYTRKSFWDWNVGHIGWEWRFPLWVAHYTDALEPLLPVAWMDMGHMLHQYSADGNMAGAEFGVRSSSIDINRLNPRYVIEQPDPDPEPEPCELPKLRVTAYRLNVRTHPRLGFNVVGTLSRGDVIEVLEIDPQQFGRVWVRHAGGWSAMEYGVKLMERA